MLNVKTFRSRTGLIDANRISGQFQYDEDLDRCNAWRFTASVEIRAASRSSILSRLLKPSSNLKVTYFQIGLLSFSPAYDEFREKSQVAHGNAMGQQDQVLQVKICRVLQPFHNRILPSKPAARLDRITSARQKTAVGSRHVAHELSVPDSMVDVEATHAVQSGTQKRISLVRCRNKLRPSFISAHHFLTWQFIAVCHGPPLPSFSLGLFLSPHVQERR